MIGGLVAIWPTSSSSQNIVGDALGALIGPAVGPVLERAAGEIVVEGVRRGYENGRLIPRPIRRRPSPQPITYPKPQPTYPQPTYPQPTYPQPTYPQPTYPQPTYPQPTYPQPNPSPTRVVPPPAPAPASEIPLPENRIVTRPVVSPNLSPTDIALTHVVSSGPAFAAEVIRIEAAEIADQIDLALLGQLDRTMTDPEGASLRADYRRLLSTKHSPGARRGLLAGHANRLQSAKDSRSISSMLVAADAADAVAMLSKDASHEAVMSAIDQMRADLSGMSGKIIAGDDLAVLAERSKNARNMGVLCEIARVMGVQRRGDLFSRLDAAASKSGAPVEVVNGILGVASGPAQRAVADMQLPSGNPAVVLYNPAANSSAISFVCDDSLQITLAPGELAPFDQAFVVGFQTGDGSAKRYSIRSGLFRWVVDENAWDLRQKTTVRLILDASETPVPFHYLLNGQPQMLDAGLVIEHTLDQPPRIDFDVGLGDGTTKSTLLTPGEYAIGVNVETGGWDLLQQAPDESAALTTDAIARKAWRDSVALARRSRSTDPADAQVDALLDSIE
jgi:hypothetical protein